jgi:ATP-dependent DNA helicase RecQ
VKALKENHDLPYMVKFIMGKKVKELTDFKYDKNPLFGKGAEKDESHWNSVIRAAMMLGLIDKDIEKYGLLKLNTRALPF